MNEYEKKEFRLRQILCVFLGLQNIFFIWFLMKRIPSETMLKYELAAPEDGLFVVTVGLILLLFVVAAIFSKTCYIALEAVNIVIGFPLLIIETMIGTGGLGILLGGSMIWRFIVYRVMTKGYKQEYEMQRIRAVQEAEMQYSPDSVQGNYDENNR